MLGEWLKGEIILLVIGVKKLVTSLLRKTNYPLTLHPGTKKQKEISDNLHQTPQKTKKNKPLILVKPQACNPRQLLEFRPVSVVLLNQTVLV